MIYFQEEDAVIILDFGSGETCKNDYDYVKRMIDELAAVDTRKERVVIKWQLFKDIDYQGRKLIELEPRVFDYAYNYALDHNYETTASVFDYGSLQFLAEGYEVPFIKIANRTDMYSLIKEIHKYGILPVVSVPDVNTFSAMRAEYGGIKVLCCVSEYPAACRDYEKTFGGYLEMGISDHTTDWKLWRNYLPAWYEVHYRLKDSTGPDAGPFARTPEQLREIL